MRCITASDYKAFRLKESFYLYTALSKGNAANVYQYQRTIKAVDTRSHNTALKIVKKLEENDISDYEGYVRAGFVVFRQPYLNMLLSDKVLKDYVSRLATRLNQFSNNIISCLHKFSVDCTTPPISLLQNEEVRFVLAAKQVENPIVRLYLLFTYTNKALPKSLIRQSMLQYKLWPLAYHKTEIGKIILNKIDHILNIKDDNGGLYDSAMEKDDNKFLCQEK
jgi:hypothetical protein